MNKDAFPKTVLKHERRRLKTSCKVYDSKLVSQTVREHCGKREQENSIERPQRPDKDKKKGKDKDDSEAIISLLLSPYLGRDVNPGLAGYASNKLCQKPIRQTSIKHKVRSQPKSK